MAVPIMLKEFGTVDFKDDPIGLLNASMKQ
jgi:hypothetical protein